MFIKKPCESIKTSKRWLHFVIFIICILISIYQLIGCINKLRYPPISSHYRFVINDTLNYPAVTICRNPPYKTDVLLNYDIGDKNSKVEHTSEWVDFPFDNITLQQFWDKSTYKLDEVVKLYGLHGQSENADVISNYYFYEGRCFTFLPRVGSKLPWPNSGWAIMMKHDKHYHKDPTNLGIASDNENDGYHVFIHEVREPYTENRVQTQFIMQYIYLEVGEEIELRLSADEYRGFSNFRRQCTSAVNYSRYQCIEHEHWTNITKKAGCTAPWLRDIEGLPLCNNYEQLKKLITEYTNFEDRNDPSCPFACNITAYKLFIVKRTAIKKPFSQLYVYFGSKLVSVMQELPGYDSNAFLADLGGSLGFFLGLSVIGLIEIIENLLKAIFCYTKPAQKDKKKTDLFEEEKHKQVENSLKY